MKSVKSKTPDIAQIVDYLAKGKLVILPTETVYIAAIDATNPEAVDKLIVYKNRPFGKPFSIAVADQSMAEHYVSLNTTAKQLYTTFLPGPVTVVSTGLHKVAEGIESETGTLGIRIPDYDLVLAIVKALGRPITATSANASYQKRPYTISDITDHLSEKQKALIDLVVDVGELPHNEPSTVIDTTTDDPVVLRQGDIVLSGQTQVLSRNEENTQNIGKELWQKYEKYHGQRPIIFALVGPMGAGKTQFTKGLARAMGITDEIVSPTFDLEISYPNGLVHIDAWRMQDASEMQTIGFDRLLTNKDCVVAIEWADRVVDAIKLHREDTVVVWVKISYGKAESERHLSWGVI